MSRRYILDASGEPEACDDVARWARWIGWTNRVVAHNEVDGVRVSTVFRGIDLQPGLSPPALWASLVRGGPLDGMTLAYASRALALDGHAFLCTLVGIDSQTEDACP